MNAAYKFPIHLNNAISKLTEVGISISESEPINALIPLIERIEPVDPANALLIARVMQHSGHFNDVVRRHISSVEIGTRFIAISNEFDGIREDASTIVNWMSDGTLDWKERLKMRWVELRRGTVTERFDKIRQSFNSVMESAQKQIAVEEMVLTAYLEFRYSIKEAERAAHEISRKSKAALDEVKTHLVAANEPIAGTTDSSDRLSLELNRDIKIGELHRSESTYQIAKDLSDNLKIAYSTSELVFSRLQQNIGMKRRIYEQSAAFFTTNEVVFTGLSATFTSTQGLSESTQALEQMRLGIAKSLDALADLGNTQLERSARAGYGSTIDSASVAKLAGAIVQYQEEMTTLVEQLRKEATINSNEIESAANNAKTRLIELATRA